MATRTSTAAASTGPVRALHSGVNSITAKYSVAGQTNLEASETCCLMVKVPNGATILDVIGFVSSAADTCPFVMGISDPTDAGDTNESYFATGGTRTVALHAVKNIPYDVSVSDDAAVQYQYITLSPTAGTATSGIEVSMTVLYTMDK